MMLKSVAVIAVATLAALGASRGLLSVAAPAAPAPAKADMLIESSPAAASGVAQVSKAADGHYWAEADVDGHWMRFLVDTGASAVALTSADAQRLGIDVASLDYDRPVKTANGDTVAASVTLDHLSIAGARIDKVDALVVKDGLPTSLLGMSYLGRLSRFEATPTTLVLRP